MWFHFCFCLSRRSWCRAQKAAKPQELWWEGGLAEFLFSVVLQNSSEKKGTNLLTGKFFALLFLSYSSCCAFSRAPPGILGPMKKFHNGMHHRRPQEPNTHLHVQAQSTQSKLNIIRPFQLSCPVLSGIKWRIHWTQGNWFSTSYIKC